MTYGEWRKRLGLGKRNDKKTQRINKMIGRRSSWGNPKEMTAVGSAILSMLYDAGPDLQLNTKDMVRDVTRKATAYGTGYLSVIRLPKRGAESCGHDHFDGILLKTYEPDVEKALAHPTTKNFNDRFIFTNAKKNKTLHRFENYGEVTTHIDNHLDGMVEKLKESYMSDSPRERLSDSTTHEESLDWMLHHWTPSQWRSYFKYSMTDTDSLYKGVCAWGGTDRHCTYHQGELHELVTVYYTDSDDKVVMEWMGTKSRSNKALREGYSHHYLDEYKGDKNEFYKTLVSDGTVLDCIKKNIPKMKTESRDWLLSTWTKGRYVYLDEDGNETFDYAKGRSSIRYEETKYGKRGHYSLNRWGIWKKEEQHRDTQLMNKNKVGTQVNGWVYSVDPSSNFAQAFWEPVTSPKKWTVVSFHFGDKDKAESFSQMLEQHRKHMIGQADTGKQLTPNGPPISTKVRERNIDVKLMPQSDPQLFTPEEVVKKALNNEEFPDEIEFKTVVCVWKEE